MAKSTSSRIMFWALFFVVVIMLSIIIPKALTWYLPVAGIEIATWATAFMFFDALFWLSFFGLLLVIIWAISDRYY